MPRACYTHRTQLEYLQPNPLSHLRNEWSSLPQSSTYNTHLRWCSNARGTCAALAAILLPTKCSIPPTTANHATALQPTTISSCCSTAPTILSCSTASPTIHTRRPNTTPSFYHSSTIPSCNKNYDPAALRSSTQHPSTTRLSTCSNSSCASAAPANPRSRLKRCPSDCPRRCNNRGTRWRDALRPPWQ